MPDFVGVYRNPSTGKSSTFVIKAVNEEEARKVAEAYVKGIDRWRKFTLVDVRPVN